MLRVQTINDALAKARILNKQIGEKMSEQELEQWHEGEAECEFAHEYEKEEFLPLLARLAAKFAPTLIRKIGHLVNRKGKKQKHQKEFEFESEGEYELDPYIAKLVNRLGQSEAESESELEFEFESAPSPEYELVMDNLAYRAAQSESEAEAEAFLGALLPVAARLFPRDSAQVISAITPSLIEGVATVGRVLHKSPKTRPLLRTVPHIVKGTVITLSRRANRGQPLTHTTALRVLADHTARVLDNPNRISQVIQKSHLAQHQVLNNTTNFSDNLLHNKRRHHKSFNSSPMEQAPSYSSPVPNRKRRHISP